MTCRRAAALLVTGLLACGGGGPGTDDPDATGPADPDAGTDAPPAVGPGCLPFDPLPAATLRASPHKAFAFYFPPFPVSVENRDPAVDQWAKWLDPAGSGGMYAAFGGYVRDRPRPRPVRPEPTWRQLDFEAEIRTAIAMGLDGFLFEYPDHVSVDQRWNHLGTMLDAAAAVDPGFRIMLSPDFPTAAGATTAGLESTIAAVAAHPSLFKLPDGTIPLASFYPERKPITFWETLRTNLAAAGVHVVFVPIFLSWNGSGREDWNDTVLGYSSWGVRTVPSTTSLVTAATSAHGRGRIWMSPVAFEDVRFKNDDGAGVMRYWEARNSELFRASFTAAIDGGADWLSLTTWNDYTESWLAPSQARGYAVVDVAAYYLQWFKTGTPPPIVRDALYYFHRRQRSDAPYDPSRQTAGAIQPQGAVTDDVELLAFLATPGTLVITQGDDVRTMDAPAGVTSFKAPIVPGATPAFALRRAGQAVIELTSATPVETAVVYQDLMYKAGGSLACER
jgi:hypothetical protein